MADAYDFDVPDDRDANDEDCLIYDMDGVTVSVRCVDERVTTRIEVALPDRQIMQVRYVYDRLGLMRTDIKPFVARRIIQEFKRSNEDAARKVQAAFNALEWSQN